ncbi:unnamed protein product [Meloidogyne enterolobii]|uniref:Uncharacterized protein n=2 Tax=Meloidogyne enterolobii TaxID=390850 RepID=A0ACB1APK1_MELEN|nr:unnamed protein product [Meloidogyne enterolobii]
MFNRQILFLFLILVLVSDICAFYFPWHARKNNEKSSSSSSEENHGWWHPRWRSFERGGHGARHHHKHKHTSTSFPASTGTVSPPSTTT